MRKIKFRVWDGKQFHYNAMAGADNDNNRVSFGGLQWFQAKQKVEVEQFTGRLDRNRIEIYEGDVISWFINGNIIKAPVYYDEQGACFWMGEEIKEDGAGNIVINDWLRGEYEIIGNIHERMKG